LATEYELVLMLDPEGPDERREKIADETRKRIESAGALTHAESWGTRKLAYEIRQRTEAEYRLFRFQTGDGLLDDLDHTLKITDGVIRFRIFKVDPGAPVGSPPPTSQPAGVSARVERGERRTAEAAAMAAERAESETEEPQEAETEEAPAEEPAVEEAPAEQAPEPDSGEAEDDAPSEDPAPSEDEAPE
jgi:small subunit ribosomal protein S6